MIAHSEREHNPFLVLYDVKQVQTEEVSQQRTAVSSKCFQLYYTCSDRLLTSRTLLALTAVRTRNPSSHIVWFVCGGKMVIIY
jgi:hypothetical protein